MGVNSMYMCLSLRRVAILNTYRLLYNCIITFLLYIQRFIENATVKLHLVLIILPCKQQNVTYIRLLNYMQLPLKRTSSYKNTHTVN